MSVATSYMRGRPVLTTLSLCCLGGVNPSCMGAKTGHTMEKDVSCLFHYFSVDLPLLVPGNLVLGGWAAIPHGKLGIGAKTPSMQPLAYFGIRQGKLANTHSPTEPRTNPLPRPPTHPLKHSTSPCTMPLTSLSLWLCGALYRHSLRHPR